MGAKSNHVKIILDIAAPWDSVGSVLIKFITFERGLDSFPLNNRSGSVNDRERVFFGNTRTRHGERFMGGNIWREERNPCRYARNGKKDRFVKTQRSGHGVRKKERAQGVDAR